MSAINEDGLTKIKDKPKRMVRLKTVLSSFRWYDYTILGVLICAFWFFFMFTNDLWHTSNCSLAYDFGHFSDFYDYNKVLYNGLDYYPLIYIIYAIWNIPLALLGISSFAITNLGLLLYEKVLACLFLLGTTVPFYLICRKIGMQIKTSVYSTFVFLTTPYIFISIFGWGMYDSLYCFFLMLGLYFFLREKKKNDIIVAMLIFGLAFSVKLISAFVVIPLLAYRQKNIFKLAGLFLVSVIPLAIQVLLYSGTSAFTGSAMGSNTFVPRLVGMTVGSSWHIIAIFIVAWVAICLFAYFADYEPGNYIKPLYICLLAGTAFFCCIEWHPQWFMILAPFSVLTTVTHVKRNKLFLFDVIFTCTMLATVWCAFPFLEEGVFRNGGLQGIFGAATNADVSSMLLPAKYIMAYLGVMTAVLIISAIVKNPWRHPEQYDTGFLPDKKDKLYAYARFIAPICFFVGPIAIWAAKAVAMF